ncbi:MAG TPA: putative lipid II flippase FtsW [Pyrinomonadaceae bacterium]|nr:putative lipid II flippase FtsW [Chloracidobacterium sp.]MBK9439716.1 putative lipid II flippase FtsW [Chloracidobacterium sp.]MBL0238991.1 putative lipid II flippase FtsW [Chloracidobacterium sp.]HQX55913.1 putative lipid II flippase FtsW [Pyrinomonadaceae bacterium]HQY68288.1 putative lipid II flippase FtsW [Pyrinomonadaceae bacterium]
MAKKRQIDWFMFAIAGGLAVFGSMMVYSASAMMAMKESSESSQYTYFLKQLMFVVIGIVLMYIVSRFDYRILNNKTAVTSILVVTSIALAAVLFFPEINGAKRWIRFSGVSFQPSELAKVALPIFLAWYLAKHEATVTELKTTVLRSVAGLVLLGGLVMLEKDLGTTIVLCLIFSAIYFAAGARMVHIAAVAGVMILAAVGAIAIAPWRVQRVLAFLDPYKYADDESYQVIQSLYAIGSGGILGEGFAKGQQKLFYLPYPYSDFIFSVVGEEFGLLGTLAIVTTFGLLLWRGTKAALNAPDRFGMLLGIGLITGIIAQALFNISVVISIMPAKGIPLPFISYGGSSVVVTLIAVGILLSISKFSDETVTTDVVARPRASGRRTRNA